MSCEEQDDDDAPHHNAIDPEGLESIFGEEGHKPLHSKQCDDEGYDTPEYEHGNIMRRGPCRILLEEVEQIEQGGTCHRGYRKEERELGGPLSCETLCHTANDSGHGTRHSRYDRDALIETDIERASLCHLVFVRAFVEKAVAEEHENTSEYKHDGHHLDAVEEPVEQSRFFGQQSDDDGGEYAHK